MGIIEQIAEERIQEARAKGLFRHLPGKGKPYQLDGYLYQDPTKRVFDKLLKDNHFLPLAIELRKRIETHQLQLKKFLAYVEKTYTNSFIQLIQTLQVNPGYPADQYLDYLKAHARFLSHDLPIWYKLKNNSRTRWAVHRFNNMQKRFFHLFMQRIQQLCDLIEEHNQEVLKQCIKERDHFRIPTTLGKPSIPEQREFFLKRFPGLTWKP